MEVIVQSDEIIEETTYEEERGKPMPSLDHSLVQTQLSFILKRDFGKQFTFASELSLEMQPKDTTPDLCIYSKMHREIGKQPDIIKMQEPPLTTIEILSPTQSLSTLISKIQTQYFPQGVKSAWVVIPELRAIVLYVAGEEDYQWFKAGTLTDPVTGIQVKVEEVFEGECPP